MAMATQGARERAGRRAVSMRSGEMRRHAEYLMMLLPGALFLFIFVYLPMPGIILAFKNYMLKIAPQGTFFLFRNTFVYSMLTSQWTGFDNFRFMFSTPEAWLMTRNTVLYNLAFISLGLVCSVALAIGINELIERRMAKLYQTVFFFPYFLSWIVVSYLVFAMLNNQYGLFNQILVAFGGQPLEWYQEVDKWPWVFVVTNLWKNTGNGSIIYLAAITSMDPDLNEAAAIDGASKWQQIWRITIPQLVPMIVLLTILNIGGIFKSNFDLFYTLPNGSGLLRPVSLVIDVYVYNAMRSGARMGLPTAAGLYQSVVGFVLILTTNMLVRRYQPDMALF